MTKLSLVPQKVQEALLGRNQRICDDQTKLLSDRPLFHTIPTKGIDSGHETLQLRQQIVNWHRVIDSFAPVRKTIEEMAQTRPQ
jgi:hypothetical protein